MRLSRKFLSVALPGVAVAAAALALAVNLSAADRDLPVPERTLVSDWQPGESGNPRPTADAAAPLAITMDNWEGARRGSNSRKRR